MYCEYCGKELKKDGTCDCPESNKHIEKNNENMNMKCKLPRKLILIISGVVLGLILLIALLASNSSEKIALEDYINSEPTFSGFDGKASASMASLFDESALETYLLEGISGSSSFSEDDFDSMSDEDLMSAIGGASEELMACEQALDDIVITVWVDGTEVSELENISNGNMIKIEAKSNNPANKVLRKDFKTGVVEFEVSGLPEGQAVDVFGGTGLKVEFGGVNGNGTVHFEWDTNFMPELEITFKLQDNHFSNGEEAVVEVNYNSEEWLELGYYPLEESRTYVVEGLSSYMDSIDDISAEQFEDMKNSIVNSLKDYSERRWFEDISIENMSYIGYYILCATPEKMGSFNTNSLHLIYKVDVFENFGPSGGDDNRFSYYYCGTFEDILIDKNGEFDSRLLSQSTCNGAIDRYIAMGTGIGESSVGVRYDGYETLEEVFENCMKANEEGFTFETDIDAFK